MIPCTTIRFLDKFPWGATKNLIQKARKQSYQISCLKLLFKTFFFSRQNEQKPLVLMLMCVCLPEHKYKMVYSVFYYMRVNLYPTFYLFCDHCWCNGWLYVTTYLFYILKSIICVTSEDVMKVVWDIGIPVWSWLRD